MKVSRLERLAFIVCLCATNVAMAEGDAYQREIDLWHAQRIARLTAPEGWLSLAGLFWLKDGENRFGSAPENALVFPKGPRFVGAFVVAGRTVTLKVNPGGTVTSGGHAVTSLALASDDAGPPTVLEVGSLSFHLIARGGRLGVRLRDKDNPRRHQFHGIERYPVDSAWRVSARFEPYLPPRTLEVPSVLGTIEPSPSPGALVFEVGGQSYRLDAVDEGGDELFIIFGDIYRLQQGLQSALCFHAIRHLSAATAAEQIAPGDHGGRDEAGRALSHALSSKRREGS